MVSLPKLLKEIIDETDAFAVASNVEIKTEIDENIPDISCARSHLKTAIDNLLSNAIRYSSATDAKSPKPQKKLIKIKLSKKNKNICFEITDNGIGIPAEDQKFIFVKFFRSRNVLTHQTQGSGLGLFIVKTIIEKMNGKIGFQSKLNQGTTFWLKLPIKTEL